MKIILYKKCILSNSYSEVFDVFHKTKDPLTNEETVALQRYLSSLTKYEITADNVYVPNSGKITLELDFDYENVSNNIYEYNYMYLEDTDNNFRRYCFIDDITVVNGLAVISFSEDIWSNYASSMEIRKSLLVRSRATKYGDWSIPFYAPGMAYEGNNTVVIKDIDGNIIDNNYTRPSPLQVACAVNIQLYNLTAQGVANNRILLTGIFIYSYGGDRRAYGTTDMLLQLVREVTQLSAGTTVKYNNKDYYYDIVSVKAIPKQFGIFKEIITGDATITVQKSETISYYFYATGAGIFYNQYGIQHGILHKVLDKEIENDYTRLGIGLISNIIPIENNSTKITFSILFKWDITSWNLYISIQNKLIEISNEFDILIPISVQSADVTQQQASARELRSLNAKLGIAGGALEIRKGMLDTSIGFGNALLGGAIGGVTGTGMIIGGAGSFVNGTTEIGKGITSIIGSEKELEIANREMFSTSKAIKVNSDGVLNGYYGIVQYFIAPDNTIEVQANIDNTGYVCNEIVDDLFNKPITDTVATAYNVMRFDFANVFGNFTQKIAKALRAILYNGFKIWYDETQINV